MSLIKELESVRAQIVDTKRLYEMVKNHPIMSISMMEQLDALQDKLNSFPKNVIEAKVQLLFSGGAVQGSIGIKSTFVNRILGPFQEMVRKKATDIRYGGKRVSIKKTAYTDLYLTALPTGSFGIELSQIEQSDVHDGPEIAEAINEVMELIAKTAEGEETFDAVLENTSYKSLGDLQKFLKSISSEGSMLKMTSGSKTLELSNEKITDAYERVSEVIDETEEIEVEGILRGFLLDSGRFEFQSSSGKKISGLIGDEIDENKLINLPNEFYTQLSIFRLRTHKSSYKTGKDKLIYELIDIDLIP